CAETVCCVQSGSSRVSFGTNGLIGDGVSVQGEILAASCRMEPHFFGDTPMVVPEIEVVVPLLHGRGGNIWTWRFFAMLPQFCHVTQLARPVVCLHHSYCS